MATLFRTSRVALRDNLRPPGDAMAKDVHPMRLESSRRTLSLLATLLFVIAMVPSVSAAKPACNDGIDNDGDGATDYPADTGCVNKGDDDETAPPPPSACNDGVDNDGDGYTDYPADPDCSNAGDTDEYNAPPPACSDGLDNDGDGQVDYPADPGCTSTYDIIEAEPCSDGIDNDGDGFTDYPADLGCGSETDDSEGELIILGPQYICISPFGLTPFCYQLPLPYIGV